MNIDGDTSRIYEKTISRNDVNDGNVSYVKIVKRAFLLAVNSITQTSPELISTTIDGF